MSRKSGFLRVDGPVSKMSPTAPPVSLDNAFAILKATPREDRLRAMNSMATQSGNTFTVTDKTMTVLPDGNVPITPVAPTPASFDSRDQVDVPESPGKPMSAEVKSALMDDQSTGSKKWLWYAIGGAVLIGGVITYIKLK